ncbi:hypothetical protein HHK36_007714 [Tetracentron sinense]|uniref:TATA-binding protein interacting (TIP20) domain-containing protein n=1 Tax=Tetracentron sinense TaxID=13715 RepID=A0A834ZI81_TETSI|nr:hypothetical protein HHK36_007714 [Tetracentron sinense]
MANLAIHSILEKMTGKDKDYRYMATSDLLNELSKEGFKADADLEFKISNTIIRQLDDAAGDVSGLAVKCLAPLVKKVSEARVSEMMNKLCDKLLNGKDQHRDIASIALKTIVPELTTTAVAQRVIVSLSLQLIKGLTSAGMSTEIKCECLDILCDVFHKFGNLMATDHEFLIGALLSQLSSNQASIRKKSISCIASIAPSLSDDLLALVTGEVVRLLKNKSLKPEMSRTNIQMIGALSRAVGYRFGPHLGDTVPVLINYCTSASENDEELREYGLQVFYMSMYSADSSFSNNGYLSPLFESANEYTDDEDISWKVRRAAAKCSAAIIVSRPEMLSKLYGEVGAFSVLKELVVVLPDCLADHIGSLVSGIQKALSDKSSTSNLKIEALIFTRLVMASHSPSVFHPYIKALSSPVLSAVGERYYKVTAEALRVCGELVRVVRPDFKAYGFDYKPYVHPIYNAILTRLANQDQDQEVKECAISCMGLVISTFGDNLRAELPSCLPVLVDRMGNEITRLTAVKAFAVIAASLLKVDLSCVLEHVIAELTTFLRKYYLKIKCILIWFAPPVKANRALRQATLGTLNSLIVAYGDRICSSAYEVIIVELSTLISDSDLHMTALALELCCTLMADRKSSPNVGSTVRNKVLPQALTLVRSSLLQGQTLLVLPRTLDLVLVHSANTSFEALLESLLSSAKPSPQTGGLAKQALYSIAQCLAVLCLAAGDQKCASTVNMLTNILEDDISTNSAKQHLALLCLGEIGRMKDLSSHAHIENIVIESFQSPFEEIKSAASYALGNIAVGNLSKYLPFILDQIDNQQKKQYLLLHSLKEVIARQSVVKAGQAEFQDTSVEKILKLLFNHCESEEEGVRNVVAECLGKIALIEPTKLVPALKVRTTSPTAFTRATVVIAVKYSIVERPEKIDEIIYPEISSFLMLIKDHDRHVRRAAVLALSTAAHNKPNLIKGLLPELLPLLYDQTIVKGENEFCSSSLVGSVGDEELVGHLSRDSLSPQLEHSQLDLAGLEQARSFFRELKEKELGLGDKQELIRTVDLGPFKHTVDDGLELRKAAFECVDTLLDSCLDQMNPSSFIVPYLRSGLDDHYDVKMPCHLILSKLADKCPAAVFAVMDSLVDPLQKTINFKPKPDAVKQEVDRNEDMIRSALRAIASLNRISGGGCSLKFKSLMNEITKSPIISEKYNSICNE